MFWRVFNEGIDTPRSSPDMVSVDTSINPANFSCVISRSLRIFAIWVPISCSTFPDISMTT